MSQSAFMANIAQGHRYSIRDIMDEFNVSMATARRWVNKNGVCQIPNVWPHTYTHAKHVSGQSTETPVGVIDTPQKLSRAESALIAALPFTNEIRKMVVSEEFSAEVQRSWDKFSKMHSKDLDVIAIFQNSTSVTEIKALTIKLYALLFVIQESLRDTKEYNG